MKKIMTISMFILISIAVGVACFAAVSDTQEKLTASDGSASDYFGRSVAVSGDFLIAGATGDDDMGYSAGAAYIFERVAGAWIQRTKLLAADGASYDYFGNAVAISGDHAVVGAYRDDDNGEASGSAYVFVRNGDSWQFQAKLTASDGAASDLFGKSVAISSSDIFIGAWGNDGLGNNSGAAYVYEWDGTSWVETAKLTAPDGQADDNFGKSVSVSGRSAVIGAPGVDGVETSSGAAYLFQKNTLGWIFLQKITGHDSNRYDYFGDAVSINEGCLVAGAYGDPDNGVVGSELTLAGSAYVFEWDGTQWVETEKLVVHDQAGWQYLTYEFGVSVAGNFIFLGAYGDRYNALRAGASYLFKRSDTGWEEIEKIVADDWTENAYYGCAVAADGINIVSGAFRDTSAATNSGSVYTYRLLICKGNMDDNQMTDGLDLSHFAMKLGNTHAGAGDFNNDGRINETDLTLIAETFGSVTCTPF